MKQTPNMDQLAKDGVRFTRAYPFASDLAADPNEQSNLANSENHAETLERLKTKLKAFQTKTKDPWLTIWENDARMQGAGVNL